MSCIHFKFKSSLDYEKLTFDGLHISLSDLKEAIMKQKKIGSVNQYTLSVKDAQSKKEYTDDQEMIPRNTSVIISRVPLANPVKIPKTQRKDHTLSQPEPLSMTTTSAPSSLPPLTSHRQLTASELQETADLASANASEEDKVKAMMNQSSKDYDPSRYVSVPPSKGGLKRHPPPPTYNCHRCGKKGHWIQLCPTNGDPLYDNRNYKRSLGTPTSQIISATANMPGVMLDRRGNLVMKKVDYQAYVDAQRKVKPEAPTKLDVPDELVCPICKKLVKDAVIIQCCSESFCYECIQEYLCENEFTCPLCKATDVSPETLVPNKALRTAAKNFQLKESEHKSVSEARGYVPIITPQQLVLASKNLPPVSAESAPSSSSSSSSTATSGVSNGPTGGVVDIPSKDTPTKDNDTSATKSEETAEAEVGETDSLTVKTEEGEKPPSQPVLEKSSSPAPQVPRPKNRSEVILDRILLKQQTPPPTATPTSSSTVTTTSSSRPAVAPPTVVAAPPTATSLLGSVGVASGLAPPTIAAASALLSGAAAAARGSGSLLGLPRGPAASSTLPGQGAVLTTSAILPPPPPVVITEPNQSQEESAKLERIAAELVLAAAVNTKKSASPPPLTAEEFYRQQKMLRLFVTKQTRKRTPSPYSGVSDYSSTPDSFRSASDSSSLSRSPSPSGSSYSGSQSRSRSRSPIASHRSHRSKKHRSRRRKHEKVRHEKSREKGKERKSGHHHGSRKKRKRHLSPESEERLSKSHHLDRKKHKDNLALSALVEDDLLSPGSSLPSGALSPEMELESQGTSSSSHRKHRHKKRSKAKRSRRRMRSDEEMDVDLLPGDFPADYRGDHNLEEADRDTVLTESVKDADSDGKVELAENEGAGGESKDDKVISESDDVAMAEADDGTHSKSSASLVPYQDSSTTETEGREQEEPTTHAAVSGSIQDRPVVSSQGSKERPSSTSSTSGSGSIAGDQEVNDAIEQLEAAIKEGTAAADNMKSGGDKAIVKEGATGNVKSDGGDEAVDEGAPPEEGEGEEGEETAEDPLMIALHVDEDAIDQDSAELLDAECPNKGKEDGEITDSDKDDGDDDDRRDTGPLSSSSTDKAPLTSSSSSTYRSSSGSRMTSSPTKVTSLKSPTGVSSVAAVLKRRDVSPVLTKTVYYSDDEGEELGSGRENDSNVDLRVILNEQKSKKQLQQAVKKHFASAVTVTSGYMSSSQPQFESSTPVDDEWSSDEEVDSASSSGSSSEVEKPRSLKASDSKHSSSSSRRHGRKHSSSKSRREKEKKRKKAKEYSESKKKLRREKEREREKAKKRKKHKKSEKYSTKYSH